jgi:hypothetical protein
MIAGVPPGGEPRTGMRARVHLPAGIWVLGFVSMLMDISSELVHSLLPVFMTTVLGVSMVTIGVIEGVAEGAATVALVVRLARPEPPALLLLGVLVVVSFAGRPLLLSYFSTRGGTD